MIAEAVRLLIDELGRYLAQDPIQIFRSSQLLMNNIADLENNRDELENSIIISLVNVEEESTLKNAKALIRNGGDGSIAYREPAVHLNLYLLFSATYLQNTDGYEIALGRISRIVRFFQSKHLFTVQNSPHASISGSSSLDDEDKSMLRLMMELYTLTFEQINHLWGSLGGKQVPFVMYKARLVSIQDRIDREVPLIEEVQRDDKEFPKPS
jgi:Pvc16 N-terminal domain